MSPNEKASVFFQSSCNQKVRHFSIQFSLNHCSEERSARGTNQDNIERGPLWSGTAARRAGTVYRSSRAATPHRLTAGTPRGWVAEVVLLPPPAAGRAVGGGQPCVWSQPCKLPGVTAVGQQSLQGLPTPRPSGMGHACCSIFFLLTVCCF